MDGGWEWLGRKAEEIGDLAGCKFLTSAPRKCFLLELTKQDYVIKLFSKGCRSR